MLLATKKGIVDLDRVVFLDTYAGNCTANSDGLQIKFSDGEDKLLVEYFFQIPVMSGDVILQLAEAIRELRGPGLPSVEVEADWSLAELQTAGVAE